MYKYFLQKIKLFYLKKKWRKKNKHNFTNIKNVFPIEIVEVGKYTYGSLEIYSWNNKNEKLIIKNYVSIASGVKFLLGGNHYLDRISTYPFKVKFGNYTSEAWSKGAIIIEDDVWLGMDSMIMSGVKLGRGTVVAARSVVTKSFPPYSVIGGNPARILKMRFNDILIKELLKINYENINVNNITSNLDLLYEELTEENIKNIITIFD